MSQTKKLVKKMMVVRHVDDLKISHINGGAVDALISQLIKKYGKEAELTIHQEEYTTTWG